MNRHLVKGFKNIQPFSKTTPKRRVSYLRGTFSVQTGRSPSLVLRVYCTVVFAIEMGFVWAHLLVLHGGGHMLPGWVFLHSESFAFTSKVGFFLVCMGYFTWNWTSPAFILAFQSHLSPGTSLLESWLCSVKHKSPSGSYSIFLGQVPAAWREWWAGEGAGEGLFPIPQTKSLFPSG